MAVEQDSAMVCNVKSRDRDGRRGFAFQKSGGGMQRRWLVLLAYVVSAVQAAVAVVLVFLMSMPFLRHLLPGSAVGSAVKELWRSMCKRYPAVRAADQWSTATHFRTLDCSCLHPAELPSHILSAETAAGRAITETAEQQDDVLAAHGQRQAHPAWCWRATAAAVLNAFASDHHAAHSMTVVDGGFGGLRRTFDQTEILEPIESGQMNHSIFSGLHLPFLDNLNLSPELQRYLLEHLSLAGMAPRALAELLVLHGHDVKFVEAVSSDSGELEFRSTLKECMDSIGSSSRRTKRMLVSYSRVSLDMLGGGHFAPVAGCNSGEDRVLLLESNSWRYPKKQWVQTRRLWEACCTRTGYGFARGYIVVCSK